MKTHRILTAALCLAAVTAIAGCGDTKTVTVTNTITDYSNRIDRMAIPAINTVFIPADQKEAFNQGDPSTDATKWHATAVATTNAIRAAVNTVVGFPAENVGAAAVSSETLIGIVIPDIVTIDLSKSIHFPNGRALTDDVIDTELSLTLNRTGISDAINANEVSFLTAFPYLAAPHMATP